MISTQGSTCFLCSRNACTREAISQLSTHRRPACSCVSWPSWPRSELALVHRSRDQDFPHFRRQVRTVRPSLNLVLTVRPSRTPLGARFRCLVMGPLASSQVAAGPCRRAAVHTQPQPSLAQPPEISLSVSSAWWVYAPRIPSPPLPGDTAGRGLAWRISRSVLLAASAASAGQGQYGVAGSVHGGFRASVHPGEFQRQTRYRKAEERDRRLYVENKATGERVSG